MAGLEAGDAEERLAISAQRLEGRGHEGVAVVDEDSRLLQRQAWELGVAHEPVHHDLHRGSAVSCGSRCAAQVGDATLRVRACRGCGCEQIMPRAIRWPLPQAGADQQDMRAV